MSQLRTNRDGRLDARTFESEQIEAWDARAAFNATLDDLSETLVREHLRACDSALVAERDAHAIYRKMDIVRRVNDHDLPRNVGLLFFSRSPERWFPGARIETSILQPGSGGDVIEEREFRGGLAEQVQSCLAYLLREVVALRINKIPNRFRAAHHTNYPEVALREVLVNALFHRRYGEDSPHTTLVLVKPDRIDVRSTPGPVAGIDREDLRPGGQPRSAPPRNPRIGELFKEIGLAEKRLTGLDKVYHAMERNGSPPPEFYFDEGRTFFQATLFAHPWQSAAAAIRKAGELRAVGRADKALEALESAWRADPGSAVLAEEVVRHCVAQGDLDRAEPLVETSLEWDGGSERPAVVVPWLEALLADGQRERAHRFLTQEGDRLTDRESIGAAIVARRLRDSDLAARFFHAAGTAILDDPRALLESAQNKLYLARRAHGDGRRAESTALLEDARILLERLLRMEATRRRHAWAWRELARARRWLGEPKSAVDEAYARAIELAPDEVRFQEERNRYGDASASG